MAVAVPLHTEDSLKHLIKERSDARNPRNHAALRARFQTMRARFTALLREMRCDENESLVLENPADAHRLWQRVEQCLTTGSAWEDIREHAEALRDEIGAEVWPSVFRGSQEFLNFWYDEFLARKNATEPAQREQHARLLKILEGASGRKSMFRHRRSSIQKWDIDGQAQVDFEEKMVQRLVPLLKEMDKYLTENPEESISVQWIELHQPKHYAALKELITDPEMETPEWVRVVSHFPNKILERCDVESFRQARQDLPQVIAQKIHDYRAIASVAGPTTLADVIVAQHPELYGNQRLDPNFIGRYIGKIQRTPGGGTLGDLPEIPEDLLERNPGNIRRIVFLALRKRIYQDLRTWEEARLAEGKSVDIPDLCDYLQTIKNSLSGVLTPEQKTHWKLYSDLIREWEEILQTPIPDKLKKTIQVQGRQHRVPSLRQMVGMYDVQRNKRMLFAWYMGQGKTLGAIAAAEHVGAKKILYVCPNNLLNEMEAKIASYYTPEATQEVESCGQELVDVISSDVDNDELLDIIIKSKIVLMPYSMLASRRQGQKLTDLLRGAGFDFVIADEVHNADKPGKTYTDELNDLLRDIDPEHFVLASGFPTPNKPNDIAAQLRLMYPHEFDGNRAISLREFIKQKDPLTIRRFTMESILMLDPIEDWERHYSDEPVQLSSQELGLCQSIIDRDDLTVGEKISRLLLSAVNPRLYSPTLRDPTFVKAVAQQVFHQLEEEGSAVWVESIRRQGILSQHEESSQVPHFVDQVMAEVRNIYAQAQGTTRYSAHQVDSFIIHGDVDTAEEEYALLRARFPQHQAAVELFLPLRDIADAMRSSANGVGRLERVLRQRIEALVPNATLAQSMMERYRALREKGEILTLLFSTHGSFEHFLRQLSMYPEVAQWIEGLQQQLPPRAVLVTSWMSMVHEGRNLTPIKRGGLIEPAYRSPDEGQLAARFAREGHAGVQLKRMMVPAGIHQPIRENAQYKFWLCMRLLEGGMVSEEALRLLERGELDSTVSIQRGRLLIGSRLTESVLNGRQLLQHYKRYLFNKGEDFLRLFIRMEGEKYAQLYTNEWEGSYSANNARFVSGLLSALRDQGHFRGNEGADVGSGPCALDATYGVNHLEASITSFDLNPHMLSSGADLVRRRRDDSSFQPKAIEAAMTCLPGEDEQFDFMTCSLALQELSQKRTRQFSNHERARALEQMHAKLKNDGVLVLTFSHDVLTTDEFAAFIREMQHFGFEVMEPYTGPGESVSSQTLPDMTDRSFRNWVVTLKKRGPILKDQINLNGLNFKKSDDSDDRKSEREEVSEAVEVVNPSPRMHHDAFRIQAERELGVEITSEKTASDIEAQDKERTYRVAVAKARALILELCEGNPEVLRNVYEGRLEFFRQNGIELVHDAPEDGEKAKDLKKVWKFQLRHASAPLILPTYRIFVD